MPRGFIISVMMSNQNIPKLYKCIFHDISCSGNITNGLQLRESLTHPVVISTKNIAALSGWNILQMQREAGNICQFVIEKKTPKQSVIGWPLIRQIWTNKKTDIWTFWQIFVCPSSSLHKMAVATRSRSLSSSLICLLSTCRHLWLPISPALPLH